MIFYRICQTYPPDHDPIDGEGPFLKGGRWNSKGVRAVYTASSLSLARSELARHVNLECIPDNFQVYEIEIPEENVIAIETRAENWNSDPPNKSSQESGDKLLRNPECLAIKVPSVCDTKSFNYVLNPASYHYQNVRLLRDYPFVP